MRNNKRDSSLIKRSNVIKLLKKEGIKRFKKEALRVLEKKIIDKLREDSKLMVRRLMLEGRKTLTEKDVIEVMATKSKEERAFEI